MESRRLLTTVKEHFLTEDLRSKQTDEKLKDVALRLSQSRIKYFREKVLNHFLRQQSIENTLLRQLLSLKCVMDQRHCLGIEERFVHSRRASYDPSWNNTTRPVVLETLKQTVADECRKLSHWIDSNNTVSSHDQLRRIPLAVEEKVAAVKLKQGELRKLRRETSRKNVKLHKLITSNCRQLLSFITDYQLQHVAEGTRVTLDHLSCKTDALWLKLNVIRLQLMVDTYSPEKTEALKEIRSHLDNHKQQLEVVLMETERSLSHYESLGPAFMTVAKEYHKLSEEIDNKRWALQELRKTRIVNE